MTQLQKSIFQESALNLLVLLFYIEDIQISSFAKLFEELFNLILYLVFGYKMSL